MANKRAHCAGCGRDVAICNKDWPRLAAIINDGTYRCRKCRGSGASIREVEQQPQEEEIERAAPEVAQTTGDTVEWFEAGGSPYPLTFYPLKK